MIDVNLTIRRALPGDRRALLQLHADSFQTLGRHHYGAEVIGAFLAAGTLDTGLIEDRTYFVLEGDGVMMACGGWSVRQPSFARLAPIGGAGGVVPKVRAVYVHPCFARKGVGRHLMNFIEAEIVRAGFTRATLMSTLTGLPLYRALGYRGDAPVILSLPGGHPFVGIAMEKRLDCGGVRRAA